MKCTNNLCKSFGTTMKMKGLPLTSTLVLLLIAISSSHSTIVDEPRRVINVNGGPDSVVWVVQLSDLHFSVNNPQRALDFKRFVGPSLSFINPSLVLITGDLTDGKSEDMLTMKLDEYEWREYKNVMEDVVKRSGLDKSVFFDVRGNHDNFGVPEVGGSLDFFAKYSINGQLGRTKNVNSVTLQASGEKHLFVGVDSTGVGVRGPTNFFGHPTDDVLAELDSELSQWDSQSRKPPTKISFGHFPLSFSVPSFSGNSLKDVFLNHSLSAYLCGHLHTKFGKHLKRHHHISAQYSLLQNFVQFNPHQVLYEDTVNCSVRATPVKEFWEWEMGDWRKSRAMRILAIDRGHVSYLDINFKSGKKNSIIILPTFPLDSRFMSTSSSHHNYECQVMVPSSYESIRALVFSAYPIVSVVARVYDTMPGNHNIVLDTPMNKIADNTSRGDLYVASWNYRAFEDPSADRYWLQIEASDVMGRSTLTELRPFSINGLNAKISWTWTEIQAMGCQWAAIYFPLLWSALCIMFFILIVPKALLRFSKKKFTYKDFVARKGVQNCLSWGFLELCNVPLVWFGLLGYLFYLILCPWFVGRVFTKGDELGYMTYRGWLVNSVYVKEKPGYIGFPDVMVVVITHLFYVVLPSIIVSALLAAEKGVYRAHFLSVTGKKEDDHGRDRKSKYRMGKRWVRKALLLVCLAICWKHFKNCRAVAKAYEMNPILHFPVYSFAIPILLAFIVYKTWSI